MCRWYENNKGDIAVSTRIRLARNINKIPFPNRITEEQLKQVNNKVTDVLVNGNSALSSQLKVINMDKLTDIEAAAMLERHIISPEFARNRKNRVLILSEDESISIMLGEEDHIRIQVIKSGMALDEAYDIADKIDTLLSENITMAFDQRLGFLTECPTNIGTGLRASVMLHLPALENQREIGQITSAVSKIGLTIRGIYGEGSGSKASLYQISNQITLGISEKAAIDNLKTISMQIIEKEKQVAKRFDDVSLQDSVYRAFGLLKNARVLTSEEMMQQISKVIWGARMGIITLKDAFAPVRLFVETQPAQLMIEKGQHKPDQRDILRANIIREKLN